MNTQDKLVEIINEEAILFSSQAKDYDILLDQIGDANIVLIGEATHGTYEFYQTRIEITKKLIEKKGFMAIAIEGEWPACYLVHRYLQGTENKNNVTQALEGFSNFPVWMWRNETLPPFLQWLKNHNDSVNSNNKVGFYGLDLYSLYSSIQAVINYLLKVDKALAEKAKLRYACFDHMQTNPQIYGYLTNMGIKKSCIAEVVEQLLELQNKTFQGIKKDNVSVSEERFYAIQNARIVKNAEHYYRSMFEGHIVSWNVRDKHMFETLENIALHLEHQRNQSPKMVVWAHNSHIGDARATEMGFQGEVNIGQLIREKYNTNAYLIGFSTYSGSVTAASAWDGPIQLKMVQPGILGSYERLFHDIKYHNFLLNLRDNKILEHYLSTPRLQRAIGVIYQPETERESHYFFSRLPYQFDSIIHFDKTNALKPLIE